MADLNLTDVLPEISAGRRSLGILLAAFAASGCAALIYEIVWFQMLQMVIGSTAVSLAVLLGTYMGGMGIGSLVLPRLISPRRHPLRVYAWFELGIGAVGLGVLFGMPTIVRFYTANAGHGFGGILLRGAVSALCLLIPTVLMGATLPILSRGLETTPRGVARMGFLYGGNTAGAVLGCLLAGFYLLRVYDVSIATYAAAAINLLAAGIGFGLAATTRGSASSVVSSMPPSSGGARVRTWPALAAIGLSGFCALGAEEIWTRLLSLMLGGTVYTFAIILAVFLAGLGLGSAMGASWSRRRGNPELALGACQFLLAAAIAYAAFMLFKPLPYWVIGGGSDTSPWVRFLTDLVRTFLAVFPPALLWGASFPLALTAIVPHGRDSGRSVGKVYAANTAGAILGAVGFNLLLIPGLGTRRSQQILIAATALAGILALIPFLRASMRRPPRPVPAEAPPVRRKIVPLATGAVLASVALALLVPRVSWELIAYGRRIPSKLGEGRPLFYAEGMNSSVAVTELDDGTRNFHVSGKVEASSDPADMRVERMLGHLPALVHPEPKSVLIVGCGAGVTAGSFVLYPSIKRIVICEIEPLIPKVVARFFGEQNYNVLDDPRVEIVYDDARHFILTTPEKFDIITSDPIHPWIKGSAVLYSQEYFEMCRNHLNPGGVITQWVPFYESTPPTVKSEIATFFKVFPEGTIWSNDISGAGYDVVLLAVEGPMAIDIDGLQRRLDRSDHAAVSRSIQEVGFMTAVNLLATYAGRGPDLAAWLDGAAINRDRNLRLQYLAGMGLNAWRGGEIFDDLLKSLKFPADLITGSEDRLAELKKALKLKP
jgi:spermidine synthase